MTAPRRRSRRDSPRTVSTGSCPTGRSPGRVCALATTRNGGVSTGPRATMNLGRNVRDDAGALAENRRRFETYLPAAPTWLDQVHGTTVATLTAASAALPNPIADAAVTRERGVVCAILTADCLPVLFADVEGNAVGVAHAGWRGLAAGVLEATIAALGDLGARPGQLVAWLGPAIGPARFEVGADVYDLLLRGRCRRGDLVRAAPSGQMARRPLRSRAGAPHAKRSAPGERRRLLHAYRRRALLLVPSGARHGPNGHRDLARQD